MCAQGEWKPKQIDNPDYKGAWEHPEIDNPEYSADSTIYKFDSIGVLGLDLWQVRNWIILKLASRLQLDRRFDFDTFPGEIWHHL